MFTLLNQGHPLNLSPPDHVKQSCFYSCGDRTVNCFDKKLALRCAFVLFMQECRLLKGWRNNSRTYFPL